MLRKGMAMATQKTRVTAEQAAHLCGPEESWELVEGELIRMPPSVEEHNALAAKMARLLGNHADSKRLGIVYGENAGFLLRRNPDTLRAADAAFVSKDRLVEGRPATRFRELAPDLVVEVVSSNDTAQEVHHKTLMWLEAGTRLVLVVYPDTQIIEAHRSPKEIVQYGRGESVDCAPVFLDLALSVDEVFRSVDYSQG